ncbi:hypothetical protein LQZ19_15915 [Treponema primitia]|uniref:hypothetical protein n=1 Tax=Treponema primitia TaxID=88058 RepID=UPI0039800E2A
MGAIGSVIIGIASAVTAIASAVKAWADNTNDIKEAPSYDEKSATIDETAAMNKLLSSKRKDFQKVCAKLEEELELATQSIFSTLVDGIEQSRKEAGISLSIDYVKREFDDYKSGLKDGISGLVIRRLALSDEECAEILRHEASRARASEIDHFIHKIIREGFTKYQDVFGKIIERTFELVKDKITEKNADKEKEIGAALREIESLNRELSTVEIQGKKKEYTQEIISIETFLAAAI